jgi:hypothetical protein
MPMYLQAPPPPPFTPFSLAIPNILGGDSQVTDKGNPDSRIIPMREGPFWLLYNLVPESEASS